MAYDANDFNGCILTALKSAKKHKRTCYVFAIAYKGWHIDFKCTPPKTQAYLKVEPDGKVFEVHPVDGVREVKYTIADN